MTDTELKRRKSICDVAGVKEIDDVSDGFHTFRQLYYQRMMLFATIVKQNRNRAWKSLRHEDGNLCFGGGWFVVGIDTPEGSYTYHYENKYFDLFDCEILDYAKHWDGHTEKDVTRLLSLPSAQPEANVPINDSISRQTIFDTAAEYEKQLREILGDENELVEVVKILKHRLIALPSAQPEKLTDKEQRIFLSAMGREEEVCKEVDDAWGDCREPYEDSLVHICKEIRRKVKGALWT